MSLAGKRRIVEMPDFDADYPDMVEPAYILFNDDHSGEFAFGCVTAHIWAASATEAEFIDFSWSGSDEMDEVHGDGDAELQPDGSLQGESASITATNFHSSLKNGLFNSLLNPLQKMPGLNT